MDNTLYQPFKPSRIASIDIFRALTMAIMIFVNDLYSITNVPHWLMHAAFDEDMLGFSDLVFPSFLFVMGMSIPLAIESQLQRGASKLTVLKNIISRTFALMMMGLFTVNYGSGVVIDGLHKSVYCFLMLISFVLVWNIYPKAQSEKAKFAYRILKIIGMILMIVLIYIYRDPQGGLFQQRWWGILGLIGWSYSFAAIIYLFNRENVRVLLFYYLGFVVLNILGANKLLGPFNQLIPDNGCFQAFAMSGLLLTLLLKHEGLSWSMNKRLFVAFIIAIFLLLMGFISHNFWIISKLQATPTWYFFSVGLSILAYLFIYYLTDIKSYGKLFNVIKPAGTATLTCYLMSYLFYAILSITEFKFPPMLLDGSLGLVKCASLSLFVIALTELSTRIGIKLKV